VKRAERWDSRWALDGPTTCRCSADVKRLAAGLDGPAESGSTVVVEHAPRVVAASGWVIDVGPWA
jgi:excinuclease UvrABC ATPase subunit